MTTVQSDPTRYRRWLGDYAVRYVAVPDAALDFSSAEEAELVQSGQLKWLDKVWSSAHWQVYAVQGMGWLCRFVAFWFLLDAFHVGGSVKNVLLVFGVNAVSTIVPFTPGGAGVQQALLLKVFGGAASGATVAAYSVGQQIATAATSFALGLAAVFFIFKFRSFGEVIRAGRADEAREKERPPSSDPAVPRARG